MFMTKKTKDLKMGFKNEKECLPIIKQFFNDYNLEVYKDVYEVIDFKSESKYIEFKSRRIEHNKFKSSLIGANKIDDFKKSNKECYIVYKYIDGLYYIKYDENLFNTFNTTIQYTQRDGKVEKSKVFNIPIEHLSILNI